LYLDHPDSQICLDNQRSFLSSLAPPSYYSLTPQVAASLSASLIHLLTIDLREGARVRRAETKLLDKSLEHQDYSCRASASSALVDGSTVPLSVSATLSLRLAVPS
jgi:hypothetical protein